jgi:hypothetical protein
MPYAHAVIEVPVDVEDPGKGVTRYNLGDEVPTDLPGYDELVEAGSVSDEEYDPSNEPVLHPEFIEIDGVRYIKTGDSATTEAKSNA